MVVVQSFSLLSFPDHSYFYFSFSFHFICFYFYLYFWLRFLMPTFLNRAPTFFHRPPTFPLNARFWLFQSKVCKEQAESKKQKQSQEVVLCHPRALRMPLCKECKKLFISSSSPIIIISYFQFTPLPSLAKFPPLSSFPRGGHDNAKRAQKRMQLFLRSRSEWKRGSVGFPSGIFSPNRDDF